MAKDSYGIKVLKVAALEIEIEVKAAFDEHVYAWPSLAVRVLAGAPKSPWASVDLSTSADVAKVVSIWIDRVEMIATRKGLAQYRVLAKKPELFSGLKKGVSWGFSALHADAHSYRQGVLAMGGKLMAVIVDPGSVVPCSPIEVIALTKKGPGATKAWLNHAGVQGLDARGDRILSWSRSSVRVWAETGELLDEKITEVRAACLMAAGVVIGSSEGVWIEDSLVPLGPVNALATWEDTLVVLLATGEVVTLSEGVESSRFNAIDGVAIAASKNLVAIREHDGRVHLYDHGVSQGYRSQTRSESHWIHGGALLSNGMALVEGLQVSGTSADGTYRVFEPAFAALWTSSAGGLVMAVTGTAAGKDDDIARARIWREDGEWLGDLALPRSKNPRPQAPSRPGSTQLSEGGAWVVCPESAHKNGGVTLVGTRGQGAVRFDNPNADYDFLEDVVQLDADRFVVSYGNHDVLVWKLDGTFVSLGVRASLISVGGGRLFTSKDKVITEWGPMFAALRTFELDVPYSFHWLETSPQGRFLLAGAQPTLSVIDLEAEEGQELWKVEAEGGINNPTFAGHDSYFVTASMESKDNPLRIWDARQRRMVAEYPGLGITQAVRWLENDTLMVAGTWGVDVVDLVGNRKSLVEFPPGVAVDDPQVSMGFDTKGQLLTHGVHTHLSAWTGPNERRSFGGYYGPSVLNFIPGWCICLGPWPALEMRMPGQ